MKGLLISLLLIGLLTGYHPPVTYNFTFAIPQKCTVSAGVYDSSGTLIRTLFSHSSYNAGSYTYTWDGLDDFGNSVTNPFSCTWKVLTNNLTYQWEGVIGNTSDSVTGRTIHKGEHQVTDMCFWGNYAYYGEGYNEQVSRTAKFNIATPQHRTVIDTISKFIGYIPGAEPDITACATDGKNVYWAGNTYNAANRAITDILYATDINTDTIVTLAQGNTFSELYSHPYPAFGIFQSLKTQVRGLAVQQKGNYILCSRPDTNILSVYNKIGSLIQSFNINGIGALCIDVTDNHVWLVHGLTVEKYRINENGTLSTTGLTISCTDTIVGLDVNRTNTTILVAEGGSKQWIKAYNPTSGALLWTKGIQGGYANGASVTTNKFYWNDLMMKYKVFVRFAHDGSFWVGDTGNDRILHFSSNRNFIEQIAYLTISYATGVDFNNPKRVWDDCKEFAIDYSKPLLPDNKSWTLVNNWKYGLTYAQYGKYNAIKTPLTMSNGHTYCFVLSSRGGFELIELQSNGNKRFTGIQIPYSYYLDKLGDLYRLSYVAKNAIWYKRKLIGFDISNNPQWSSDSIIESYKANSLDPIYNGDINSYRPNAVTTNGTRFLFDRGNDSISSYHITGVKKGKAIFRTGKSTSKSEISKIGVFPVADKFNIGNRVINPAGSINAVDSIFFLDYYGENWQQTETNMFNVYHQCGLAVGQFGVAYGSFMSQARRSMNAIAGDAGNSFAVQYLKLNDGTIRIYHNDESIHGGLHRWKVGNLSSIHILSGNFTR